MLSTSLGNMSLHAGEVLLLVHHSRPSGGDVSISLWHSIKRGSLKMVHTCQSPS